MTPEREAELRAIHSGTGLERHQERECLDAIAAQRREIEALCDLQIKRFDGGSGMRYYTPLLSDGGWPPRPHYKTQAEARAAVRKACGLEEET